MLDSSFAHPGAAGEVLGSAAEARMHRLQQEAAAAAAAQSGGAAAGPSTVRRVVGFMGDLCMLGIVGGICAGGFMYAKYDTKEVEHMIEETKKDESNQFWGHKLWLAAMEQYLKLARPVERKVASADILHTWLTEYGCHMRSKHSWVFTLILNLLFFPNLMPF